MKKILFLVTGFGYGDSIRIHSVIQKIQEKEPNTKVLILGYDTSFNYFESKFKTLKIKGYKFADENLTFNPFFFVFRNFFLPITWKYSYLKNKKQIKAFEPDVIVSDFEPLANLIGKKLRKPVITIFGFNPKTYQEYPKKDYLLTTQAKYLEHYYKKSKLTLIPTFFEQKKIQTDYTYLNPIVRTTEDLLPDESHLMKKLKLKKQPILIMLGGSNFGYKLAKDIFHYLRNKEEVVIFGGKKQIPGYHYTAFQPNFLEYLKVCKGVITLAGHITLSEALVFKKPMLIFPIKNHVEQQMNAYTLRNIATQGNPDEVKSSLNKFFADIKNQQKKLDKLKIESDGAEQAADKILSL